MSFKGFFSIFSSGGYFVQLSGTILAILVKGHKRNITLTLGHWLRKSCILKVFLFLALAVILFSQMEPF